MSHAIVGFYESIDPAAALVNLAAIQDSMLNTSGDDITVPEELSNLIGATALVADTVATTRAQVASPSLRQFANVDVEPFVQDALTASVIPELLLWPQNPIPLSGGESINFLMETNPAAAEGHYGLVWLSDGAIQPVTGRMIHVRATSSITLSAGAWVNGNLTLSQDLPVGKYQIVGLRATGTGLVAARIYPPGAKWRAGALAVPVIDGIDPLWQRNGQMGVWGEFHTNQLPTMDCLGASGTAQVYILDLIPV